MPTRAEFAVNSRTQIVSKRMHAAPASRSDWSEPTTPMGLDSKPIQPADSPYSGPTSASPQLSACASPLLKPLIPHSFDHEQCPIQLANGQLLMSANEGHPPHEQTWVHWWMGALRETTPQVRNELLGCKLDATRPPKVAHAHVAVLFLSVVCVLQMKARRRNSLRQRRILFALKGELLPANASLQLLRQSTAPIDPGLLRMAMRAVRQWGAMLVQHRMRAVGLRSYGQLLGRWLDARSGRAITNWYDTCCCMMPARSR